MGFSEISLQGSDKASDLLAEVQDNQEIAIDILNDHFHDENGAWNTPGYVNVALVLVDSGIDFRTLPGYNELVDHTLKAITITLVSLAEEDQDDEIIVALKRLADGLITLQEMSEAP